MILKIISEDLDWNFGEIFNPVQDDQIQDSQVQDDKNFDIEDFLDKDFFK